MKQLILILATLLLAAGCGPPKPVLYPNAHYARTGKAQAQADIRDCVRLAKESGVRPGRGRRVARSAAAGSAVGAVAGGAVGSMSGNFGKGVAIGAVGGGAGGFARGVVNSREPDAVFEEFVDRCLREKGYEPMGWQ